MDTYYRCKKCGWKGRESELDADDVETCFGDDQIEICPQCGSLDVVIDHVA